MRHEDSSEPSALKSKSSNSLPPVDQTLARVVQRYVFSVHSDVALDAAIDRIAHAVVDEQSVKRLRHRSTCQTQSYWLHHNSGRLDIFGSSAVGPGVPVGMLDNLYRRIQNPHVNKVAFDRLYYGVRRIGHFRSVKVGRQALPLEYAAHRWLHGQL